MPTFILDKNVDLKPHHQEYPKYFFDDLKSKKAVSLAVGGSNYKKEIFQHTALLDLMNELNQSGKIQRVPDEEVDAAEELLKGRIKSKIGACPPECDDHHIFALAKVSNCLNILTKETRMAKCRDKIRQKVGHQFCPNIRIVRTEASYLATA